MSKKDFFRLIIKLFGLYFIISIFFSVLPANFIFVMSDMGWIEGIWLVLAMFIAVSFFILLIFKPDFLIKILRLDKGFDEGRIDFQNFSITNLVKLATLLLGGYLIISNLSPLLSHTLFIFKSAVRNEIEGTILQALIPADYVAWATSIINILIGYFLLTNCNFVGRLLKVNE